ncbi:hypothetical protein PPTG_07266 [Phytophthora nicotianae INRA-310]|uniref:DUF7769 domain-containing protein n=1 Tax=Phytophthora nicotianae (strain INRA-310) TaxID=761204 RepID=W2QS16_PHYN3|nr:hypothetical protein PPTG_07266 [Phytophthora nicotianae INRA-310]ETN15060.1 hypothetical protein PPTG_07266 [Phytophthora nicotianae INRA-310]
MLRRQATDQERQAIWETLLRHSNRGVLAYGEIAQAAEEFGFHRSAVSRMWKRGSAALGTGVAADVNSHKHERGRKKVDRVSIWLFVSIQSVQSRTTSRTIQDIIQEVEHAWEIMTAETLNKTFLTLQLVMKEIMNYEGRNDYKWLTFTTIS